MDSRSYSPKERLRQTLLERRMALSTEMVLSLSKIVQERLMKSTTWKQSEHIALYSSVKNEIDTKLLFMKGLEEGKSIYFPRVEQGIQFYEVTEPSDLQKGAWGILEPKHGCSLLEPFEKLKLVIVPGIVFDVLGFRIGYGRGFYDRLLQQYPNKAIGLAYDFQMVEKLDHESWDRPVWEVITEKKEYATCGTAKNN